jgi:hypothetical protein
VSCCALQARSIRPWIVMRAKMCGSAA